MNNLISSHKMGIKECFNKAADTYDQHNKVNELIGMKLINSLLIHSKKFKHIIDLGCGTGTTTHSLASHFNYKNFYAIDISDKLLLKAKERLFLNPIHFDEESFEFFNYGNQLFDL